MSHEKGRDHLQAPIIPRGAYLDEDSAVPWLDKLPLTSTELRHGGFSFDREEDPMAMTRDTQSQPKASDLPPLPKSHSVWPQGAVTIKTTGNGAHSDKTLEQVLAMEKAALSARYHTERSPRLRELGLESDATALTLVDAVAQVVCACKIGHRSDNVVLSAIDSIVDFMNDCFLGKAYAHRTASQFELAINGLIPRQAWVDAQSVISSDMVFKSFKEGKECSTFQQLAVRNNALASLRDIASMTSEEIQELYLEYMNATAQFLLQDGCTAEENYERAYSSITRLVKESAMLRIIHCMGGKTLVSFAQQKSSSVPRDILQRMIDAARITNAQITEIWNLWYDCMRSMLKLKSQEQQLHPLVLHAVQQALLSPSKATSSSRLLNTAAELKRNLEAQACAIFSFNSRVTMSILEPLQVIQMHVASAPYFVRFHLLFLSGLFPTIP